MFAITLMIVVINVFTRYFADYIIPWGEEVATTCFVYTTFVGAAWCLRTHQNVGVDLLVDRLPARARKIVHTLTDLIVLSTNGYVTWLSYQFVISSKMKTMPILKFSSVWLNSALILGFGLMTIYSLMNLIKTIREPAVRERKEDVEG